MNWIDPLPTLFPSLFPDLYPLVAQTLFRRGLRTPAAARAFLDPQYYTPTPADQLPGLSAAVDHLEAAIRARTPICVWGDFDVDGQTSTTILFQTLQDLRADVTYHIPIRERESHGVNLPHLQEIIDQGARLILTCDTGITAHAAVDYARSRNVDMIITDHHDLPASLPQALAIIDPKLLPGGDMDQAVHPLSTLSGAGVAYKLAEELYARFGRPGEASGHLDLAALGLVADLAQLTGDARYLVQCGLEALRHTERLGLQIMMQMAELNPANLNEEHIGFALGPRLNALGRLDNANPAVELFTTSDPVRARVLATQLEGLNMQRQLLCSQVTQAAEAQLRADPALLAQPVLVLAHPSWPGGVVGIVASRLVERYRKPAILFSAPTGQSARGSARSIEGLNITAAISAQQDLLLNFGGHPMAAGLALDPDNLPEFRRRLARTVAEMLPEVSTKSNLAIDDWLELSGISLELTTALESLAPFGHGNEELTLATRGLKLQSAVTIGRGKEHLKLVVADEQGNSQTVLWWNGADEKDTLPEGRFDLAYNLRASDWRGVKQIQMEFVDFRSLEPEKITLKKHKVEVVDYRGVPEPVQILTSISQGASIMVWAEGSEKKAVDGRDRRELVPADALAIWSTPPSPQELRLALEIVQPQTVYLFAVIDPNETPETFVARLAGLLKYAINHRDGRISWSELETATAQRSASVQRGLAWLVSQGQIAVQMEKDNELVVSIGASLPNPATASNLWAELRALLAETAAYRSHFLRADKDALLVALV